MGDVIALMIIISLFIIFLYLIIRQIIILNPFITAILILVFTGVIFGLIGSIFSYYFPNSKLTKMFKKLSDLINSKSQRSWIAAKWQICCILQEKLGFPQINTGN